MGGEQETYIGDCSWIYLEQDIDGFLKKHNYLYKVLVFPLTDLLRSIYFAVLPHATCTWIREDAALCSVNKMSYQSSSKNVPRYNKVYEDAAPPTSGLFEMFIS